MVGVTVNKPSIVFFKLIVSVDPTMYVTILSPEVAGASTSLLQIVIVNYMLTLAV